jgi:hypothetical protein
MAGKKRLKNYSTNKISTVAFSIKIKTIISTTKYIINFSRQPTSL